MSLLTDRCRAEGEAGDRDGRPVLCGTSATSRGRIDNPLRRRPGVRANPGASRFFLSPPSTIRPPLRRRSSYKILGPSRSRRRLGESTRSRGKMLSKRIENAQKKVEAQTTEPQARPRLRRCDEEQGGSSTSYRREVLEGRDMGDTAREQLAGVVVTKVGLHGLRRLRGVGPGAAESSAPTPLAGLRRPE